MLVFPGVELTQNSRDCEPAPPPGMGCFLHVNALVVGPSYGQIPWQKAKSKNRLDIFGGALDATKAMGGIAQLNHPNFDYSADAKTIISLAGRGPLLVEIANQSGVNNEGDTTHPDTESLWDAALTAGATVYGVATDDAHHYNDAEEKKRAGQPAYIGDLGFIMVRAEKNQQSIKEALQRGDFYSSTGVLLERFEVVSGAIEVVVDAEPERIYTVSFIGEDGKVLSKIEKNAARFSIEKNKQRYIRVRVNDDVGRQAWTQAIVF
jgi:S1-C subfamily serine protease